ncbi:hypothetical protein [Nonomuraea insulae]|uniref:Integral membrane protein n=1 Tax=Nonomuraea insulae TaxID=1616787 RepID=A0ABW1CTM1_9ACTN
MALPIFGAVTRNRPAGTTPPPVDLAGLTELRVHGVGGSTPQNLLADLAPQQVWGDGISGFYRTADTRGRHVEGYSWGGLTSRSGTRVLWLLLLPFALANLAGWMWPLAIRRAPRLFRVFRIAARMAALALTLNVLFLVSVIAMDYVAYQCGGNRACVASWWPNPLRMAAVAPYPGRRLLVGALVPLLAIGMLAGLSYRSQLRYEQVRPPGAPDPREPCPRSAAGLEGGLRDPDFWNTSPYTRELGRTHLAAGLALLAVLIAYATRSSLSGQGAVLAWWWPAGVAAAVLAGAVAAVVPERVNAAAHVFGRTLLGGALLALALAALFAWLQPRPGAAQVTGPHELPGLRPAMTWMYGGLAATLLLVLACLVAASFFRGEPGRKAFRWGAPFMVLVLAAALANAVLIGLLIRVAAAMGEVRYASSPSRGAEPVIAVLPVFGDLAAYLFLEPLAAIVLFACVQAFLWWRAGRADNSVREEYSAAGRDRSTSTDPWLATTVDGDPRWSTPAMQRWATRVARARRLAVVPLTLDLLLTGMIGVGLLLLFRPGWGIRANGAERVSSELADLATALTTLLPIVVLMVVRAGWKDSTTRRTVGVLWDVGTFWPRGFHPLAPPSYAERAVPELQRRVWFLHDNDARILLAGHSQGTILATAALAQSAAVWPPDLRVVLVTFGSPLRTLYGRNFPAYFTDELAQALLSDGHVTTWKNFYYLTDYIGGSPAAPGLRDVDRLLPDPPTCWFRYGDALPQIGSHSGYWHDRTMWDEIDALLPRTTW